jgi:hypothetical protein
MLCSPVLTTPCLSTSPEEIHHPLGGSAAAFVPAVIFSIVRIRKFLVALLKHT